MAKLALTAGLVLAASVAQAGIYSYRAPDGSVVFTDERVKGSQSVKIEQPMVVPAVRPQTADTLSNSGASEPLWPEPQATTMPRQKATAEEAVPAYDQSSNTSWNNQTQGMTVTRPTVKKAAKTTASVAELKPVDTRAQAQKAAPIKPDINYNTLRIVSPTAESSRWVGSGMSVELTLEPALQPGHVVSLRVNGREVAVGQSTQLVVPDIERGQHSLRAAVLDPQTGKQLIVSNSVQVQVHRPSTLRNTNMLHPSVPKP